ncbi:nucleoside-diphosphate kinase [Candidatus Curtissbacteria bacterium]|nr:nucleoside-diphosphate kinase [Candidatus Curtissbacteria bacterium]
MQRTVAILKPDALQRGVVGEIIHRFERKGLKLMAIKMLSATEAQLEEHYAHHKDKPFFADLKKFMMSTPLVAVVLEGVGAVAEVRRMAGVTSGREAELGSIRGDFSISRSKNIIHVSDSPEAAEEEIVRFFEKSEIYKWDKLHSPYTFAED